MPLCRFGCNQKAVFKDKDGFKCSQHEEDCPAIKHKERATKTPGQLRYEAMNKK